VLASPTEHGYHVTDYYDTAADLGSREAFESLVAACHEAGIKVVFDLVINHTSRDHPVFQMHAAGVDAYADHYRRADGDFDVTDTDWAELLAAGDMPEYYFNWRRIPNLNFDSPAVRECCSTWSTSGARSSTASAPTWRGACPTASGRRSVSACPTTSSCSTRRSPRPLLRRGEFDVHYDTSLYDALRDVGAGDAPADAIADAFARAEWLGFDDRASRCATSRRTTTRSATSPSTGGRR